LTILSSLSIFTIQMYGILIAHNLNLIRDHLLTDKILQLIDLVTY